MWLASAVLTLLCLAGTALGVRWWEAARRDVLRAESLVRRVRVTRAERELYRTTRQTWAEQSGRAEAAVDLGSEVTELTHKGIAALTFGILDAIPQTSERSKAVRGRHDDIAGTVYGAINAVNTGFGAALRTALTGNESRAARRPAPRLAPRPAPRATPPTPRPKPSPRPQGDAPAAGEPSPHE